MKTVKSFGVLSVAKTFAVIYGLIGLAGLPLSWIINRFGPMPTNGSISSDAAAVLSRIHLLIVTVVGVVTGFLMGALSAAAYNLISRWTGGIQVELSE